jgi:hypothetical protein
MGRIALILPILRSLNPGALTQLKSEVFTGVRYKSSSSIQVSWGRAAGHWTLYHALKIQVSGRAWYRKA